MAANALLAGWDQFAPEGGTDLEEIEQRVQRLLRLGGGVLVEHVAEGAVGNLPRPVCAGCGKQMEVACRRAKEPEGLVGRYRLQRTDSGPLASSIIHPCARYPLSLWAGLLRARQDSNLRPAD